MKTTTLKLTILMSIFLWGTSLGGVIPAPPTPDGYPVTDVASIAKITEQTTQQAGNFEKQIDKMEQQYQDLENEVSKIAEGNFTQSQITSKLKEVDDLIKQASSLDGESYKAGTSQFSKNYPGYNTIDNINSGTSYDDFYKNNANTTLATMDNSIQAIETDKANNTGTAVDDTIAKARSNILAATGTTQAVSSLAEINIEILKQLQSMHMQLAAMAETQNAASAKEIQEKATEKAEVTKDIAKDAEWVSIDSGKSVDKLKF